MQTYIALLRGINVGGHNKIPMASLRDISKGLGWQAPQTYIASGNLIFDAGEGDHAPVLAQAIEAQLGLSIPVLLITASQMRAALQTCPYTPQDGKLCHAWFHFAAPDLDVAARDKWIAPDEDLSVTDAVTYFSAPSGIARSKLAEKMIKVIGTDATARNLNTLRKLVEMLDARDAG